MLHTLCPCSASFLTFIILDFVGTASCWADCLTSVPPPLCLPSMSWTLQTRLYRPGRVLPQPVPGQLHWTQQRHGVLRLPPLPPRRPLRAGLPPGHLQVRGLALHHHGPVLSSAPKWRDSVCHPRGRLPGRMPLRLHTQRDKSVRTCSSLQSPDDVSKSNTTCCAILKRFCHLLTYQVFQISLTFTADFWKHNWNIHRLRPLVFAVGYCIKNLSV